MSDPDLQHEALHATHMIAEMFDKFAVQHGFAVENPDIAEEASKVADALGELYQIIGSHSELTTGRSHDREV